MIHPLLGSSAPWALRGPSVTNVHGHMHLCHQVRCQIEMRSSCRFTAALTKSMPPFTTWSLPASLVALLPWQTGAGANEKSTVPGVAAIPHMYPDVLPKVQQPLGPRDIFSLTHLKAP